MPIDVASNCWTKAGEDLAAALPQLADFQAFARSPGSIEAAKFVRFVGEDKPANGESYTLTEQDEKNCHAIIGAGSYSLQGGQHDEFKASGTIPLLLERMIPEADHHKHDTEAENRAGLEREFANMVGNIMEQLIDYWRTNGGPFVRAILTDEEGIFETDEESWENVGHWMGVELQIDWGLA